MLRHVRLIFNRAGPRVLRAAHAADTKCYLKSKQRKKGRDLDPTA